MLQQQTTAFHIEEFDPSLTEAFSIPSLLSSVSLFLMNIDNQVGDGIPWLNVIWKNLLRLIVKHSPDSVSLQAQQAIVTRFSIRLNSCASSLRNELKSNASLASIQVTKFFLTLFVTFARQFQTSSLQFYSPFIHSFLTLSDIVCFIVGGDDIGTPSTMVCYTERSTPSTAYTSFPTHYEESYRDSDQQSAV